MARRLSEIRADLRLTRARAMAASLLDKPRHAETFMNLTIEAIEALSGDIHRLELGAHEERPGPLSPTGPAAGERSAPHDALAGGGKVIDQRREPTWTS